MTYCKSCHQKIEIKLGKFSAKFVKIKPGKFLMGSPKDEPGRWNDEVQHEIRLSKGFEMQATPVTQEQWETVMGSNPSYFKGPKNPVEKVSWDDAQKFISQLNKSQNRYIYRLPTEAEWEYAARADNRKYLLDKIAWYLDNSGGTTHPVGLKNPNAWGLYDMLGNVWEWCQDLYGPYAGDDVNPIGPVTGSNRVLRGGSWRSDAGCLRLAFRFNCDPGDRWYNAGLRLSRSSR